MLVAGSLATCAQPSVTPQAIPSSPAGPLAARPSAPTEGGKLHGIVKCGNTPLPGVTVTAQNTLTGKRYSTTTDITGAWWLTIPSSGRYVIRTQFAAFAPGSQEALLNASNRQQTVTFDLMLASRAALLAKQEEQGPPSEQSIQAIRQLTGNGAQSLNLLSSLMGDTENQNNASAMSGTPLPPIAGNSGFGEDSVAISGQTGQVSPLAGLDMDRIRDAIETMRLQNGGQGGSEGRQGVLVLGGPGGFNMAMGGGPGGGFMGGPGGFGGGRMIFRNFNPAQPHGAIFWMGSNSALDALPFALNGQPQVQPASGTNRFGITFISAPYLPHFTKPSGKDTVFLTLSGSRDSSPLDQYAVVPTDAERRGDFSASGLPAVYDPANDTRCSLFGATPGTAFSRQRHSPAVHRRPRHRAASRQHHRLAILPRAEPRRPLRQRLQLSPAHHRANQQHAAGHSLHARAGQRRHAARAAAASAAGRSRVRGSARTSTSTTTGAARQRTTSTSSRSSAATAPPAQTRSRRAIPSATTRSPASSTQTGTAAISRP